MPDDGRKIQLPAGGWEPRPYQLRTWSALERGIKRAIPIWHRRAGKDELAMHWTAVSAFRRPGVYWHLLPEAAQARKAIWSAVNAHTGRKRIDEAFPLEIRKTTRENEMSIEFVNGALWQVVGSDNYNSLVGSPPVGVVFSEWALADPLAWTFIRPVLAENGGWALFITTPRGKNHAERMFSDALNDPTWFAERLAATQTGVFTPAQLAIELAELQRELGHDEGQAMFDQEYMCDFTATVPGAIWGREMLAIERSGRMGNVPVIPNAAVHTAWDIGYGDTCVIWLVQGDGLGWRIVGCIYGNGVGLDYYANALTEWAKDRSVVWGTHLWPHDGGNGSFATGETYKQTARKLGLEPLVVLERTDNVWSDLNVARQALASCAFNTNDPGVAHGFHALQSYAREWDDERKTFKPKPRHDWASHFADAFRYFAVGRHRLPRSRLARFSEPAMRQVEAISDSAPRGTWRPSGRQSEALVD